MTDFDTIFAKYYDKDHWGHFGPHGVVTLKVQALERVQEQGLDVGDNTPDSIKQYYHDKDRQAMRDLGAELAILFLLGREREYRRLVKIVRYDQPFTLELCQLVTGRKFRGLSNKAIKPLLAELCNQEVQS